MQIFIEPFDVLLFRDGRPFSAGEGHRARSIFPPTPNTMQGVIRSQVLAARCGRYQQYRDRCHNCAEKDECTIPTEIGLPANLKTGEKGDFGNMQIKGPLIAHCDRDNRQLTCYFPTPTDLVRIKEKENSDKLQLKLLQPLANPLPGNNNRFSQELLSLWTTTTKPVEAVSGYLQQEQLQQYLLEKCPQDFTKSNQLYEKESRFGIEVDYAKQTVQESKLYQTEFIRCLPQVGLYLEIEGIKQLRENPEKISGLIAIGGENKVASYQQVNYQIYENNFLTKLKQSLAKTNQFKLYLATPTIFQQGWLPQWINKDTLKGKYKGIQVHLKAAAISRYQTIGGWDVAHNRPKPTLRAVGAGSVYYFITDANPEKILETFHWQNIADDEMNAQIGYGLSLVGSWNYLNQ